MNSGLGLCLMFVVGAAQVQNLHCKCAQFSSDICAILVQYMCPYCEYLTMNGVLGLCLMFVLFAAQVGESSSGKVVGPQK